MYYNPNKVVYQGEIEMTKKIFVLLVLLLCEQIGAEEYQKYIGFDVGQSYSKLLSKTEDLPRPSIYVCMPADDNGAKTIKCQKIKHSNPYLNVYVGYKINDRISYEHGIYSNNSFDCSKRKEFGETKIHGIHAGFVFPVNVFPKFEILPGVGVTYVQVHSEVPSFIDSHQNGLIPRIMMAAQYQLTDKLKIRGSFVFHSLLGIYSDNLRMNSMVKAGIGLNYLMQ